MEHPQGRFARIRSLTELSSLRIWKQLPPELAERIVSLLPANEVPCTVRLVNKAAAAQFHGPKYTTTRLSAPVPKHAFAQRWGGPDAVRGMSRTQRTDLMCLTARSGVIDNLALAAASTRLITGIFPSMKVLEAAAAAKQLEAFKWALQHGHCILRMAALEYASSTGLKAACEACLAHGCPWSEHAVYAAASSGHVGLMHWLILQRPSDDEPLDYLYVLHGAAEGCKLGELQRLLHEWQAAGLLEEEQEEEWKPFMLAAAAGSATADWQAKVAWLEAQGFPQSPNASAAAGTCSDALARLTWLQGKGYPLVTAAASRVTERGAADALRYLLERGVWPADTAVHAAAVRGHLDVLVLLIGQGYPLTRDLAFIAASGGHVSTVTWLLETVEQQQPEQQQPEEHPLLHGKYLFRAATQSGNLGLMSWLRQRGCPWDAAAYGFAAEAGSEEALEWLAHSGCPREPEDVFTAAVPPYAMAANHGDLATMQCLRRLGWPWDPAGATFTACVRQEQCPPPVLAWLVAEGCPVDWEAAVATVAKRMAFAESRWHQCAREAWEWLRAHSGSEWWQQRQFGSLEEAMERVLEQAREEAVAEWEQEEQEEEGDWEQWPEGGEGEGGEGDWEGEGEQEGDGEQAAVEEQGEQG
ncbi:hypothetical protein Agub_g1959 [Astrephomene gubernaculifera]|uniref:Uncharacterized protein n=1 Tax=Astrephomene gubernaculifera TaxID=47775 RepID=A0AAD3HI98_9CHLO|nr:hypothetical protein Agub_g1959 [Astrephomene gubernaculifera]